MGILFQTSNIRAAYNWQIQKRLALQNPLGASLTINGPVMNYPAKRKCKIHPYKLPGKFIFSLFLQFN